MKNRSRFSDSCESMAGGVGLLARRLGGSVLVMAPVVGVGAVSVSGVSAWCRHRHNSRAGPRRPSPLRLGAPTSNGAVDGRKAAAGDGQGFYTDFLHVSFTDKSILVLSHLCTSGQSNGSEC